MFCGVGDHAKGGSGTWTGTIVNGRAEPDPEVARLSEGEQLAAGAMVGARGGGNFCTGTLVGDNAVLTAAHCVWGRTARDIAFAIGRDAADPVHVFRFSEIRVNPRYGGGEANDNALCILAGLASQEYPDVTPIPANAEPLDGLSPAFVGRRVQNAGYGSTTPGGGGGNTLRWWTVEDVVSLEAQTYDVDGRGVTGVCFGDSGGPSMLTFPDGSVRVVGTLSGGDSSCVDVDTFVRTDASAEWWAPLVRPAPGCAWGTVGRCDGDVARWCVGTSASDRRTQDCAASGAVCGADADGNHRCIAGRRCPADLTGQGRCEAGDVAVWCEDGFVRRRHCRPCGQVCRWIDAELGNYCG